MQRVRLAASSSQHSIPIPTFPSRSSPVPHPHARAPPSSPAWLVLPSLSLRGPATPTAHPPCPTTHQVLPRWAESQRQPGINSVDGHHPQDPVGIFMGHARGAVSTSGGLEQPSLTPQTQCATEPVSSERPDDNLLKRGVGCKGASAAKALRAATLGACPHTPRLTPTPVWPCEAPRAPPECKPVQCPGPHPHFAL